MEGNQCLVSTLSVAPGGERLASVLVWQLGCSGEETTSLTVPQVTQDQVCFCHWPCDLGKVTPYLGLGVLISTVVELALVVSGVYLSSL